MNFGAANPNTSRSRTSTTQSDRTADNLSVRGVCWSDFDQVDSLTRSLPFRTRICACNAKPSGTLCTCFNTTWKNTPQAQCVGLFVSLVTVLFICSVIPTLMGVVPSVIITHINANYLVSTSPGTPTKSSVAENLMTFFKYIALGSSAHVLSLISRLPWLSFRRSVYARAIVLLRILFLPRAMLTTFCSVVSSIVLYYIYATSAGIGGGLPNGVRGGSGDHVWGQMLYVCPSWGTSGTNAESHNSVQSTCVNNIQWLSFLSAITAGFVSGCYFLYNEQYVLSFPSVHRRRLTRLFPRIAKETKRGPVLALISTSVAYLFSHVLISREYKHWMVTTALTYLHGTKGIVQRGGLLDTTDPRLVRFKN